MALTHLRGEYSIILGSRLAEQAGIVLHSPVTVISYQGQLTPLGRCPQPVSFSRCRHF